MPHQECQILTLSLQGASTLLPEAFCCPQFMGAELGQKGYFTMPYDYLAARNLSSDFWTIRVGELI